MLKQKNEMEKTRLVEEAKLLIEQSQLESIEKENLLNNIEYFMSLISKDSYVSQCKWAWFDEGEDGHGLDLIWDWHDVKGCFGFYADNGHGFSFEYGDPPSAFYNGGEGGEHGFYCGIFVDEHQSQLAYMGY